MPHGPRLSTFQALLFTTFFFEMEGCNFRGHRWVSPTQRGIQPLQEYSYQMKACTATGLAVNSKVRGTHLTVGRRIQREGCVTFPRPAHHVSLQVALRRVWVSFIGCWCWPGDSWHRDLTTYRCFTRKSKLFSQYQWLFSTLLSFIISG